MAAAGDLVVHRFSKWKAVDAVRWLPSVSTFDRLVAGAVCDPDSGTDGLEIHSVALSQQQDEDPNEPSLLPRASWSAPSRISALRVARTLTKPLPVALSTYAGSLHFLFVDPIEGSVESELSVAADGASFHSGPVAAVDLQIDGRECVTVGNEGRVHLVSLGEAGLESRRVHDSRGLVSHTAVRWGSPAEFATGGLWFGLQWWDQRKPGGPVSQFKGNWTRGTTAGIFHSIDIHPSRKHICIVGGSAGTVFAWDLRWQQQPLLLSGIGLGEQTPSESEVWEVHYDSHIQSSFSSAPSSKILPVMICSEDGMLTVLEQGEEPKELLAEPCAINSFDIDMQNPSDIICSLEWETIALLMRPRDTFTPY